jgi:hypothetical protein
MRARPGRSLILLSRPGEAAHVASQDIRSLLNRHRAQLRLRAHRNRELQQDWEVHGEQGFAFEILDTLTPQDTPDYDPTEDLQVLEQLWLERLTPFVPTGYTPAPKVQRLGSSGSPYIPPPP